MDMRRFERELQGDFTEVDEHLREQRIKIAVALVAIAVMLAVACSFGGCGKAPAPIPDHGYGTSYDYLADDGLRLRALPSDPITREEFDTFFDKAYQDTEACTGIQALGPLTIIVPDGAIDGGVHPGQYRTNDPLVLVERAYSWTFPIYKHEFVHHLLDTAGFDKTDNHCHRSPLFLTCAGYDPGGC